MQVTDKQICEDLFAFLGRLKISMAGLSETHSLTPIQLHTLYTIMHGADTTGHIANELHCDASNITGVIDRLVSQDLVTRQESPLDRRTKTLALTAKGSSVIQEILDKLPHSMGCNRFTPAERVSLHRIIKKYLL
jgi:DNA-binding MarR family transcriptional regulator